MGKGSKRRLGNNYEKNFEKIFGDKKAVTSSKRFDGQSGESKSGVYIVSDIEPFKSPITGELITTRSQLRQHHKDHGTTDVRDYSPEYFSKKQNERAQAIRGQRPSDRKDRIDMLREQFNR